MITVKVSDFHGRFLYDFETGNYHYRASPYDPATGRFLSEDPIGFVGGSNFYSYVGNNPTNYTDPYGLYGTNSCEYYKRRCSENGGGYYCLIAPLICEATALISPEDPDPSTDDDYEGFNRCTRQCLQDLDAINQFVEPQCGNVVSSGSDLEQITVDHLYCWKRCGFEGRNP